MAFGRGAGTGEALPLRAANNLLKSTFGPSMATHSNSSVARQSVAPTWALDRGVRMKRMLSRGGGAQGLSLGNPSASSAPAPPTPPGFGCAEQGPWVAAAASICLCPFAPHSTAWVLTIPGGQCILRSVPKEGPAGSAQ
mmetsp:Transcript_29801/g.53576  ORF Transcript_29801/g.53576 Transcript_29801/m.53576 type:complete len:139 (-) Transcript_29801:1142-1558(-)